MKMRMVIKELIEVILRVDINDVKVICFLGFGGFGFVFEVMYNNCKVVLKKFYINICNVKVVM